MKKLIGVIAVLLLFASCGGNNEDSEKFDVVFVEVSEENQKLFQEEIGTNAELYLENLAQNYKISQALPITVFEREESELSCSTKDLELDGYMFTVAVEPITSEDIGDRIKQTEYQTVVDDSAMGYVLNVGNDNYISYLYFPGDQRSYSFLPTSITESLQLVEENKSEALFAGKTETDQLVAANVLRSAHGLFPQILTSFNCQLSNGTTLRVGFLAEKK